MRTIGNIIWFCLAGFWSWLAWNVTGLLFCLTIIGIPVGLQFFKLAQFGLFPFGKDVSPSPSSGHLFLNLLWILTFGWQLAMVHVGTAITLCISIIGIPFAMQSLKLAMLSLFPFGAEID